MSASGAPAAARSKRRVSVRAEADALLGRAPERVRHEVVTPEGVPVRFVVAAAGERIAALALDTVIQGLLLLCLVLGLGVVGIGSAGASGWFAAVGLVVVFLLRHGYFAWFESGPRGATPGKRRVGIRVVDRSGGPLTTEAVIVRNLTRDVEFWLPAVAVTFPDVLFPGAPGWARFFAVLWLLGFAFLPLFNRLRLRVGDIVAGTLVVVAPKVRLYADVGRERPRPPPLAVVAGAAPRPEPGPPLPPAHVFTDAQLDVYGIYELQVLEEVLRRAREGAEAREAIEAVARKIRTKIAWPRARWKEPALPFLRDFYAALRGRLERRMLLGKRKEDKFSK